MAKKSAQYSDLNGDCSTHISFINFVDDILKFVSLNCYYGRYPYTVNPVENFLLQTYPLKKRYRRSLLVLFSLLIVLVGGYFDLGLSLSPVIV